MTPISRRRFVRGGIAAGAVVVGGSGVVASRDLHGARRFLHGRGLISGPDRRAPNIDAPVEYGTLPSTSGSVNYGLFLPPGTVAAMVWCLHGRGGSRRDAFDGIGVHRFVAARKLPWGVASLDGGESFWHRRKNGSDTSSDLFDVLMPFVASKASVSRHAIIGWSMGGYGALLLAQQHLERFDVAVANSPSIWPSFGSSTSGAFDDAADFAAHDVVADASRLAAKPVRVDCGADDPFADVVRDIRHRVPSIEGGIHEGFHEDATWRSYLPAQLDFMVEHLRA